MSWMIDPLIWEDPWFRSLSPLAQVSFVCLLTGPARNSLPGLLKAITPASLAESMGHQHVSEVELAFRNELVAPWVIDGRPRVNYDPLLRVVQIPMAPKYNHADNPNVLTGWYRRWKEVPDCHLARVHVSCLRLAVNFDKPAMQQAWYSTFGAIEEAMAEGRLVRSYAALSPRGARDTTGNGLGNGLGNGSERVLPPHVSDRKPDVSEPPVSSTLPERSGSEIRSEFRSGSGSGSDGFETLSQGTEASEKTSDSLPEAEDEKSGSRAPKPGPKHRDSKKSHDNRAKSSRRRSEPPRVAPSSVPPARFVLPDDLE